MSNPHLCFSFALVVMGAATCMYPMWKTVAPLFVSSFLSGLCFYLIAAGNPTTTPPIWAARKWRKAGAGTQNLRHCDKFGGAGVAQACAGRRKAGAGVARKIMRIYL